MNPDPPPSLHWDRLPTVRAEAGAAEVMARMRNASKRGKMPGFREVAGGRTFAAGVFGLWWDHELVGEVEESGSVGDASVIRLRGRQKQVLPAVLIAVLVLSVWPGVLLMDTLIPSSWGWIGTHVWWWYIPLTVVSNVWTWVWASRKNELATRISALETIDAIVKAVGGRIDEKPGGSDAPQSS